MNPSPYLQKVLSCIKKTDYDVAVMYSGGKDSAYLLYLLSKVYNLKVKAVIVDNGFENDCMWKPMMAFPEKMGIDLEILKPEKEFFSKLFNTLIIERDKFKTEGINHICFICNNLLWCYVCEYAHDNNIPFVASGLSLAQLSSGRTKPLEINEFANAIAERSTRMIFQNALKSFEETSIFKNDEKFKKVFLSLKDKITKVRTIYPYIYHNIPVAEVKAELSKLGWIPPKDVEIDKYISSGCKIMGKVIPELEKLGLITLNEREQAKAMFSSGLLDEDQLEFANYDASKDIVDISNDLFTELNVKEYLISTCKQQKRDFIDPNKQ